MTYFVSLLMSEWKKFLIATVILSLVAFSWLQTNRLKSAQETLAQIKATAQAAQNQTEKNLETIRQAVPLMVDAASKNAVSNYRKRYSNLPATGCVLAVPGGVRPEGGDSAPASTSELAHPSGERMALDPEFIQACARDAGRLMLWIELCKLNPLTCQVVE
jgi:hypothetical protein